MQNERLFTVGKLGTAVTIAYASSYHLLAILAKDIAHGLGLAGSTVFLAWGFMRRLFPPWSGFTAPAPDFPSPGLR